MKSTSTSSRASSGPRSSPREASPSSCFSKDVIGRQCPLQYFVKWAAKELAGQPGLAINERNRCPLLHCRKAFEGQNAMVQHLRRCQRSGVVEYWCYRCGKAEHFDDHLSMKGSKQPLEHRKMLDRRSIDVEHPRAHGYCKPRPVSASHVDGDSYGAPSPMPPSDDAHAATTPGFELDPCLRSRSGSLDSAAALAMSAGSPESTVDSEAHWQAKAASYSSRRGLGTSAGHNLIGEASDLGFKSTMRSPAACFQSCPGSVWTSRESSASGDELYLSDWSDGLITMDESMSKSARLSVVSMELDPHPLFGAQLNGAEPSMAADDGVIKEDEARPFSPFKGKYMDDQFEDRLGLYLPDLDIPTFQAQGSTFNAQLALTDTNVFSAELSSFTPQLGSSTSALSGMIADTPRVLVQSVRSAMETALNASRSRLRGSQANLLAMQLSSLSIEDALQYGVAAMAELRAGRRCSEPLRLLCFIHIARAMGEVVTINYGAHPRWSRELFLQALLYSAWVQHHERDAYIDAVSKLWQPTDLSMGDAIRLARDRSRASSSHAFNPVDVRGGRIPPPGIRDELEMVAQIMLDKLEYATVNDSGDALLQTSEIWNRHLSDLDVELHKGAPFLMAATLMLRMISHHFHDVPALSDGAVNILERISATRFATSRKLELEVLHLGSSHLSTERFCDQYLPLVRSHTNALYAHSYDPRLQRAAYQDHTAALLASMLDQTHQQSRLVPQQVFYPGAMGSPVIHDFLSALTSDAGNDFSFENVGSGYDENLSNTLSLSHNVTRQNISQLQFSSEQTAAGTSSRARHAMAAEAVTSSPSKSRRTTEQPAAPQSSTRVEANSSCSLCGYRPKGDPRWFGGSMAKHMKLQHAATPPKIYRCPYPGCTSQFQKRPDNLRQHQIEKRHFVDGQNDDSGRISKRNKR